MTTWKVGDVTHVRGKGDFAIADIKYIARGRLAGQPEYMLAPLSPGALRRKRSFALRVQTSGPLQPSPRNYTADQIQAAIEATTEAAIHADEVTQATKERARGIASGVSAGMIVDVAYKSGNRPEVVAKVGDGVVYIALAGRDPRRIPARFVSNPRHQVRRFPAMPLSDDAVDALLKRGWVHIKLRHSDVIGQSYVVAFTPEGAARNADWRGEGAGDVVYHDSSLNIYWRNAGSMD
jgi:hypothetical protein